WMRRPRGVASHRTKRGPDLGAVGPATLQLGIAPAAINPSCMGQAPRRGSASPFAALRSYRKMAPFPIRRPCCEDDDGKADDDVVPDNGRMRRHLKEPG